MLERILSRAKQHWKMQARGMSSETTTFQTMPLVNRQDTFRNVSRRWQLTPLYSKSRTFAYITLAEQYLRKWFGIDAGLQTISWQGCLNTFTATTKPNANWMDLETRAETSRKNFEVLAISWGCPMRAPSCIEHLKA